jgi:DNA-binding XRE family transcriptional regulator
MGRPSDPPDPALAAVLRAARVDAGKTQEDLAHEAGITTTTLARIEGAKTNPSWTTVRRLAVALSLRLDELGRRAEKQL